MKSILLSIKPKYVELIASGEKTIEVRKSAPQEVPFKAYIYETKGKKIECGFHLEDSGITLREKYVFGMKKARIVKHYRNEGRGRVIGEFICDKVIKTCGWRLRGDTQQCAKRTTAEEAFPKLACLTIDEIIKYAGSENREVCGWHISDLKIYDKPRALSEFGKVGFGHEVPLKRPPQSWQYIEDLGEVK